MLDQAEGAVGFGAPMCALAAIHGSTAPDAPPVSSAISWASESVKRAKICCSRVSSAGLAVITRASSTS